MLCREIAYRALNKVRGRIQQERDRAEERAVARRIAEEVVACDPCGIPLLQISDWDCGYRHQAGVISLVGPTVLKPQAHVQDLVYSIIMQAFAELAALHPPTPQPPATPARSD